MLFAGWQRAKIDYLDGFMPICCPIDPDSSCVTEDSVAAYVRVGVAVLVSGQSMAISLAVNDAPPEGSAKYVLHGFLAISAVVVFLLAGIPLAKEAWRQVCAKRIVVEQMFLVGVLGAFFASLHSSITGHGSVYYEVVAVLMSIYCFGQLINARKRREAISASDVLRKEFETCVRLNSDGTEATVPVSLIQSGDRVMIHVGCGVPVDGKIEKGQAFIRETPLTGEPFPVVKRAGDRVLAGSSVLDQAIVIVAESAGENRQIDRLLRQVELSKARPAECQRQADRVVEWFLPLVLFLAMVTFGVWTFWKGWITGLFNGLSVLVVACPCAMGLATPIAIWNALGALAKRGVLAFSGEWVERVAEVDTVVFDKTGTLSEGELTLVDFVCLHEENRNELQAWIGAVQKRSLHPVARAFLAWSEEVKELSSIEIHLLPGVGIEARFKDCRGKERGLQLGNRGLLDHLDIETENFLKKEGIKSEQYSHEIFVKLDSRLVAKAILREKFRESMSVTMEQLKASGFTVEVMTGDRPESVQGLGWTGVSAGLSPVQKAERVKAIQAFGKKVLFIGDGINDSPAIAEAHASLAMSGGAGIAKEAAHAVLYGGDLSSVVVALVVSRKATSSIRGNLRFALFYNFIGIGLAVAGIISPVVSAILMLGSSLWVTWRALRVGEEIRAVAMDERFEFVPILKKEVRMKKRNWQEPRVWASLLFGISLGLQGPLIAWMGGLGHVGYFLLGGGMILLGTGLTYYLSKKEVKNYFGYYVGMLSTGTLGMLIGWIADAGFAPVVSHGACMCGCSKSMLVKGVAEYLSGMNVGMVLGSIPALILLLPDQIRGMSRELGGWFLHAFLCVGGMIVGMEAVGMISGQIKGISPQKHFLLALSGMTVGMVVGMIVGCLIYVGICKYLRKDAHSRKAGMPT